MWVDVSLLLLLLKKTSGVSPLLLHCMSCGPHTPDWEPGAPDVLITGNGRSPLQPRVSGREHKLSNWLS